MPAELAAALWVREPLRRILGSEALQLFWLKKAPPVFLIQLDSFFMPAAKVGGSRVGLGGGGGAAFTDGGAGAEWGSAGSGGSGGGGGSSNSSGNGGLYGGASGGDWMSTHGTPSGGLIFIAYVPKNKAVFLLGPIYVFDPSP